MKVLVTGGAGFIGSHIADRLLAEGHRVTVVDDLSTGRLEHLPSAARFVWKDIRGADGAFHGMDAVVHLAGRADLMASIDHPGEYHRINVGGTVAVLDACRRAGVPRVIYAASSTCYGDHPPVPTREDAPCVPVHPYGFSKWQGEQVALHWGQVYGIQVLSLRLFNVYGPRMRAHGYGAVLPTFLAQKANGQPLTIVGDGTQRRDFVWVEDVAEAFALAVTSDATGVMNIGAGQYPHTVNYLAALIGGSVVHIPTRGGEPAITWADSLRATCDLHWVPTVSLSDGVARVLKDLDAYRTLPVWTPERIAAVTQTWHERLSERSQ